jgi:hypothetical protein
MGKNERNDPMKIPKTALGASLILLIGLVGCADLSCVRDFVPSSQDSSQQSTGIASISHQACNQLADACSTSLQTCQQIDAGRSKPKKGCQKLDSDFPSISQQAFQELTALVTSIGCCQTCQYRQLAQMKQFDPSFKFDQSKVDGACKHCENTRATLEYAAGVLVDYLTALGQLAASGAALKVPAKESPILTGLDPDEQAAMTAAKSLAGVFSDPPAGWRRQPPRIEKAIESAKLYVPGLCALLKKLVDRRVEEQRAALVFLYGEMAQSSGISPLLLNKDFQGEISGLEKSRAAIEAALDAIDHGHALLSEPKKPDDLSGI